VLGADETLYKVKGRKVLVGFVVDAQGGTTLGFEVLFEGDGEAFKEWLEPYAKQMGAEVLISDDNDSYGVAAAELGLEHQLCVAHVSKYVAKRSNSILEQAEKEYDEQHNKLKKLAEDLKVLKGLLEELSEEGVHEIERLHLAYLWASPPLSSHKEVEGKANQASHSRLQDEDANP
jgi:hypothetical protein